MIIRDKQDLKKCVKQCVRRAQVIETKAASSVFLDDFGIAAYLKNCGANEESLQELFESICASSPFDQKSFALLAALDALKLPAHDLDKAESLIHGYQHHEYISAVLSSMRARRVLVHTGKARDGMSRIEDERIACALTVDKSLFIPGRYGIDYERAANEIAQKAHSCGSTDIVMHEFDSSAFRYCLIPVSKDEQMVLHVHLRSEQQLHDLIDAAEQFPESRIIVGADENIQRQLIVRAVLKPQLLVQLSNTEHIAYALRMLGTRFIPYASGACRPEEMLGGWIYAKEALWQAMYDAYLPIARAGYGLTFERIEADVEMLLCGNYNSIHTWPSTM